VPDFNFSCPFCNQELKISSEMSGQVFPCPNCAKSLKCPQLAPSQAQGSAPTIPSSSPSVRIPKSPPPKIVFRMPSKQQQVVAPPDNGVRQCPFCGEEILAVAIKCKHCGSDITMVKQTVKTKPSEALGIINFILPVCALFMAWFLIAKVVVTCTAILLTIILIAVEAGYVGAGRDKDLKPNGKKRAGPIAWFFFAFFLWLVAYPWWMARRAKYGLTNMLIPAIVIVLLVFGTNIVISCLSVMRGSSTPATVQDEMDKYIKPVRAVTPPPDAPSTNKSHDRLLKSNF
jgi:hypothetical protein